MQSKHFGCNHWRVPSGLPSKLRAGRANTRDYIANRCVLLKYASASRVASGARGLARGSFCTRGTVKELEAPAAELGFADTLISVEFPDLGGSQARRNFEESFGFPGRERGGEPQLAVLTWPQRGDISACSDTLASSDISAWVTLWPVVTSWPAVTPRPGLYLGL